jgi:HTTM domain
MQAIAQGTVNSNAASGWLGLKEFFFAKEVPYGMALARISLPLVLLVDIVRRWPFARELYSTDGAIATLHSNFGQPDMLPEFSAPVAVALFTMLAVLLVTSAVGWCTRLSLGLTTGLYYYFTMLDCLSTVTKYTVIANHLLLLLTVSSCGDIWSVDAWLRRRRVRAAGTGDSDHDLKSAIWAQRLCQILFGMIYLGAGITKMHTAGFFSGDQLVYWMMTYINNEHPLGDYLTQYPLIVSITCYTTFFWEIGFIFTIFNAKLKWWVLAIGTIFHFMTVFTLGLIIFPIVITASYLVFLDEADVRAIARWPGLRWLQKYLYSEPGMPATANADAASALGGAGSWRPVGALALTLAVISLVAVEAEYLMDPYQTRGPGGPLPLAEMDDAEVRKLLGPDAPMRQCDKMLAFDLGTRLVGEHLPGHRREFRQGEQIVAQVTLSPPHEDMWIDCTMCESVPDENDEEGRLVPGRIMYQTGQYVFREAFRSNFFFRIDNSIEPGEYFLKLRSGNEEVARKRFTVLPGIKAAAAN